MDVAPAITPCLLNPDPKPGQQGGHHVQQLRALLEQQIACSMQRQSRLLL